MLRSHRTHFSFGIYFLYHRMGGHHVIPKCSPHDVYVAFLLPFKVRMQCLHYSARTEERVVADPSTQVSPKRIEMNDCVRLCGYASRRLGLRRRRVARRSLTVPGPMGAPLFGSGTKSAINGQC